MDELEREEHVREEYRALREKERTPLPQSWKEFTKGGTALQRNGFQDGTWMDPADARPMRAHVRVRYADGYETMQMARINVRKKPTIECGLIMWPASIRVRDPIVGRGTLRGYVCIGQYGYEFHEEV